MHNLIVSHSVMTISMFMMRMMRNVDGDVDVVPFQVTFPLHWFVFVCAMVLSEALV